MNNETKTRLGLWIGTPLALLLGAHAFAWAATPLKIWSSGDTLTAVDLNANFAALSADVAALDAAAVKVTGDQSDIAGKKTFTNNVAIGGTLNVTGNTAAQGTLVVNGVDADGNSFSVAGHAGVNGNFHVNGQAGVNGNVHLNGHLYTATNAFVHVGIHTYSYNASYCSINSTTKEVTCTCPNNMAVMNGGATDWDAKIYKSMPAAWNAWQVGCHLNGAYDVCDYINFTCARVQP